MGQLKDALLAVRAKKKHWWDAVCSLQPTFKEMDTRFVNWLYKSHPLLPMDPKNSDAVALMYTAYQAGMIEAYERVIKEAP
jgi:hypothetical protein